MKKNDRRTVAMEEEMFGRYDSMSRESLIASLDAALEKIPEELRKTAVFEIDMTSYPYDPTEYPKMFMRYQRPETDAEMEKRLKNELALQKKQEEHERKEFERLQKKFAK